MRAVIYVPGRGRTSGPEVRTATDALEWVKGYLRPGPLPVGSTVHIAGRVYTPTGTTGLRPLGRE